MIVRRAFLAGLGGVAALAPVAAFGAARPLPQEIALPPSYVTNLPEQLPHEAVEAGAELRLVREPERRYDAASVAVFTRRGSRLGYLPTDQSRILAPLLDAGLPVRGEVIAAGTTPRPFLQLNLILQAVPNA